MDLESLRFLASLGVGGAIAGIMFFAYREDFKRERKENQQERERHAEHERALLGIIERSAATGERMVAAVDRLEATLDEQHRFLVAAHERLAVDVAKVEHDVRNLLVRK